MVTRVQFRNVLREGGRIPQEILMTATIGMATREASTAC